MIDQHIHDQSPWRVPSWLKERLLESIPDLPLRYSLPDEAVELLWQMIDGATQEFRRAAVRNELDLYATLGQAEDLAKMCSDRFGMNSADFERLAFEMVRSGAYAGFFGLYLDRWLLDEAIVNWSLHHDS
jgi:hypothetical protein